MKPVKKVSDLSGPALDWAVAKCEGVKLSRASLEYQMARHGCLLTPASAVWRPTRDWSIAGAIIDREHINLSSRPLCAWSANGFESLCTPHVRPWFHQHGETARIAAMRCYVASKMGDTIEIPKELI